LKDNGAHTRTLRKKNHCRYPAGEIVLVSFYWDLVKTCCAVSGFVIVVWILPVYFSPENIVYHLWRNKGGLPIYLLLLQFSQLAKIVKKVSMKIET
jgi:hypothetical protein